MFVAVGVEAREGLKAVGAPDGGAHGRAVLHNDKCVPTVVVRVQRAANSIGLDDTVDLEGVIHWVPESRLVRFGVHARVNIAGRAVAPCRNVMVSYIDKWCRVIRKTYRREHDCPGKHPSQSSRCTVE